AETFLYIPLQEYRWHVEQHGGFGGRTTYPLPSLTNLMLPTFTDRWATGPGQHTRKVFDKVRPAL
ncbi:hypothetical protein EJ02DRAFT_493582, partial [Clathrospora elynae]